MGHDEPRLGIASGRRCCRYIQLGGRIAVETDYPMQAGSMPVQEFALFKNAGISNMDIIVAATKNSAAAIDREADLGTLEVGKLADIVVVGGDPLANIQVMGDVDAVILEGKIIKGQVMPPPRAVGGIAQLPDVASDSGSSTGTYAALAAAAAAALLALTAGAWYTRRRWLP